MTDQCACPQCGSTTRARTEPRCADCKRRRDRERYRRKRGIRLDSPLRTGRPRIDQPPPPPDDSDIVITPSIRAYLAAFDAYLHAKRTGDTAATKSARNLRALMLEELTDHLNPRKD